MRNTKKIRFKTLFFSIFLLQRMSCNLADYWRTPNSRLLPPLPHWNQNKRWIKVLHTKNVWVFFTLLKLFTKQKWIKKTWTLEIGSKEWCPNCLKGKSQLDFVAMSNINLSWFLILLWSTLWSEITSKQKPGRGMMTTVPKLSHSGKRLNLLNKIHPWKSTSLQFF